MNQKSHQQLSRRERQIMDVLYQQGEASVHAIIELIASPPSYSTVRALLARLVEKQVVTYRQDGARYIYFPITARDEASESAMKRLVKTFFEGSAAKAVNALLGSHQQEMSKQELEVLEQAIAKAKSKVERSKSE